MGVYDYVNYYIINEGIEYVRYIYIYIYIYIYRYFLPYEHISLHNNPSNLHILKNNEEINNIEILIYIYIYIYTY